MTLTLVEETEPAREKLVDPDYPAAVQADANSAIGIAEVRAALAQIPGSLTTACIAERDELPCPTSTSS